MLFLYFSVFVIVFAAPFRVLGALVMRLEKELLFAILITLDIYCYLIDETLEKKSNDMK